MSEKVVGYTLLIVGLIVIVFAAINIFAVFTGKAEPVQLFNFAPVVLTLIPGTKPTELFPARDLNQMANISAQLFLMGFLAGIGQKLASLGVQLVRPIVIKTKDDKITASIS